MLSLHRQAPGLQASSTARLLVRTEVTRIRVMEADIAAVSDARVLFTYHAYKCFQILNYVGLIHVFSYH